MDKANEERWAPVVGFENWYSVSDFGRVRRDAPGNRTRPGLILRPQRRGKYLKVDLYRREDARQVSVHRLVAEAFLPNPHSLPQVNHLDGDRDNNRVENLEWADARENRNHCIQVLGNRNFATGERHGSKTHPERVKRGAEKKNARLSDDKVRQIRSRPTEDAPSLAAEFGVNRQTIQDVLAGRTWKHVTE